MIISTVNTPAAKGLIANMPIVILFKAIRGAFAPSTSRATRKPIIGNQPSASFR